jgi:hypothetical protein
MLLNAIGRALTASGVPSYVYLSQMNNGWLADYPRLSRALGVIEQRLAGFGTSFDARNIRFEPTSTSRSVGGITYLPNDAVHMRDSAGVAPYVARQLCALEAQVGKGASCAPSAAAGETK